MNICQCQTSDININDNEVIMFGEILEIEEVDIDINSPSHYEEAGTVMYSPMIVAVGAFLLMLPITLSTQLTLRYYLTPVLQIAPAQPP